MKKFFLVNYCIIACVVNLNAMQLDQKAATSLPSLVLTEPKVLTLVLHHIHKDKEDWLSTLNTFKRLNLVNKHCHNLASAPSVLHQVVTQIGRVAYGYDAIDIAARMKNMYAYPHPAFQLWLRSRKQQTVLEKLLFEAAKNNDPGKIKELIEIKKVNVNACDSHGKTALSLAASFGANKAIIQLLHHNPDVNLPNKCGWTPLKKAADKNHLETVALLLDAKAAVNQEDDDGYTPLLNAYNKPSIAKLLIAHGANVNHQAHRDNMTALLWATQENQLEVLQLLIAAGAHDKSRNKRTNRNARDVASIRAGEKNLAPYAQSCLELLEEKFGKNK